ncbi:hypothetical protein GDO86_013415 [Hymenochirus boettgeri]|uniref:MARVEL domain-containing protein n=1 Tax=Hymenochirus boettgeri TaxID=247094 RepID=A0A8T2IWP6_9PIPI|nr:hypothetical protein GDO86_013415 [Hymenochirus boettgeri]
MGDSTSYQTDNRVPRKHRHHQESDLSSANNKSRKIRPKDMQENDHSNHDHYEKAQSRNKQDRSTNHYQERDKTNKARTSSQSLDKNNLNWNEQREKYYKERDKSRNQPEKAESWNDKGQYCTDKAQHRNQDEVSQKRYPGKDDYKNETTYERNREERNRSEYQKRNHYRENDLYSKEHRLHSVDSKDQDRYYPDERSFSTHGFQLNNMEYVEEYETNRGILECNKCRYLCTGRACCQILEVLLNMLILICSSVSYNSTGGYTGITNLGGIYYYQFGGAYSGFSAADGEQAQKLDVQFYQLKLPTVTAAMAFGGALMSFSCLLILLGVLRIPWRFPIWLIVECILDILIAIGYVPALYFYFRHLQESYDSQVCKDRESLYSSKGYAGFSCALHGADIAVGLFACMAIIAFFMSAVLAVRAFRRVRQLKRSTAQ